ncbi:MAG: voltage-gated chloride channel family protein [Luteolibacter sp.]
MKRAFDLLTALVKWLAILLPLSAAIGSASAFFLWSMKLVTETRFSHPWLLYFLPLGGLATGLLYRYYGSTAAAGNNLLIDEIHKPGAGVPRRLAPLVLLCTLITHLFGGSAGREGTAVQMGGGIAATWARWLRLDAGTVRILLMVGVAAGFGSIFGAPVAGAIFALEVLMVGRMQYEALIPCFFAALVADWTTHAWGVHHAMYVVKVAATGYHTDLLLLSKVVLAGVLFGGAARLFSVASHRVSHGFQKWIPAAPLRPMVGGLLVIALVWIVGTPDYLGIGDMAPREGTITLGAFFTEATLPASAWFWKLAFTVITLSSGFKGGEVTPLFFIGAALGHALSGIMGVPVDFLAALGFVAVFAGATNTPVASTFLGMELFGADHVIYIAAACLVAYCCSGHSGIYSSQRIAIPKFRPYT